MTKEAIINKHWDDPTNLLDAVPKMMDEYAQQEAIGFYVWIVKTTQSLDTPPYELYESYLLSKKTKKP